MEICLVLVGKDMKVSACALGSQLPAKLMSIEMVEAIDLIAKMEVSTAM